MCRIVLFGGTSEGREIAAFCAAQNIETTVCVATDYGEQLLPDHPCLRILAKRQTEAEMVSLLRDSQCDLVIDATHPYAELVTDHVANACKMVGVEYVRVVRRESATDGCVLCRDVAEVVAFLNSHPGPIFLTTGSKLLPELTSVEQYGERCTVRILPNGVENAVALGYRPEKIIGAQGPFSVEENVAQMKAHHTSILVTKESGAVGGFPEKLAAAKALGVTVVVLCRPTDETGVSVAELKHRLEAWT